MTPPAEDTSAVALSPEEAEQRRKFEELWDAKTIVQGCQIFEGYFLNLCISRKLIVLKFFKTALLVGNLLRMGIVFRGR